MASEIVESLFGLSEALKASLIIEDDDCKTHRDRIRQTIDEGILLLGDLKSYRNSIASISMLPDEILQKIFLEYILLSSDPYSSKWTRRILRVCRKWRSVALDHAKLWSWISSDSTRRMYRWEKRSKAHPLHCKLDANYPVIFLRNSERIRSLEVMGSNAELRDFFHGSICSVPMLESLSIQSFGGDLHDDDDMTASWTVPSWIVDGGAPRLRSLRLGATFFSSSSMLHLLKNLSHLELEREPLPVPPDRLPTLRDVIQVLRQSPNLETLTIHHYIDNRTIWEQRSLSPLLGDLAQLCHLRLKMDVVVMATLLESIIIPPSATMHLNLFAHIRDGDENASLADLDLLMVRVRKHFRQTDAPELRSMSVDRSSELCTIIAASTESVCSPTKQNTHFILRAHVRNQKEIRKALTKVLHALPLSKVTHLDASAIIFDEQVTLEDANGSRWEQFSPQTWRTLLVNLLPRGITIRITVSEGLISLFNGMLEAVERRGTTKLSTRGARRYFRTHGEPRFGTLQLIETRLPGPGDKLRMLYHEWVTLLFEYEGLVRAARPSHQALLILDELCIDFDTSRARHRYAYHLAPRLFDLTSAHLKLNGELYDPSRPETFAKMREKDKKELLRIMGSDSEDDS